MTLSWRAVAAHLTASADSEQSPGPWYPEQQELGFNYRITDLQAACLSQHSSSAIVDRRQELMASSPIGAWMALAFLEEPANCRPLAVAPEATCTRALFEVCARIGVQSPVGRFHCTHTGDWDSSPETSLWLSNANTSFSLPYPRR